METLTDILVGLKQRMTGVQEPFADTREKTPPPQRRDHAHQQYLELADAWYRVDTTQYLRSARSYPRSRGLKSDREMDPKGGESLGDEESSKEEEEISPASILASGTRPLVPDVVFKPDTPLQRLKGLHSTSRPWRGNY